MTGLLNPKSSEFQYSVAIFFVVYLSHGIVHRGELLFSSKISFWVRYRAQMRSLRKKWVHLYRGMPLVSVAMLYTTIRGHDLGLGTGVGGRGGV